MKILHTRTDESGASIYIEPSIAITLLVSAFGALIAAGMIIKTVNSSEESIAKLQEKTNQQSIQLAELKDIRQLIVSESNKVRLDIDNVAKWSVGIDQRLNGVAEDVAALKAVSGTSNINWNKNE